MAKGGLTVDQEYGVRIPTPVPMSDFDRYMWLLTRYICYAHALKLVSQSGQYNQRAGVTAWFAEAKLKHDYYLKRTFQAFDCLTRIRRRLDSK